MTSLIANARRSLTTDLVQDGMRVCEYEVPYKLVEGYPKITVSTDSQTAQEQVVIRASDLEKFWAESFPGDETVAGYLKSGLARAMPNTNWLTRQITAEPFTGNLPGDPFNADPDAPVGTYDTLYRVTIDYGIKPESQTDEPPSPPETVTWTGQTTMAGAQALTVNPTKLVILKQDVNTDSSVLDQDSNGDIAAADADVETLRDPLAPLTKLVPTVEHTLRISDMPEPTAAYWTNILNSLGKVNSGSSVDGTNKDYFFGARKHTVLFLGFSATKKYRAAASSSVLVYYDIELRFSQKHISEGGKYYGWNHTWNSESQKWVVPLRTVSAQKKKPLYESANFDLLLKGAQ